MHPYTKEVYDTMARYVHYVPREVKTTGKLWWKKEQVVTESHYRIEKEDEAPLFEVLHTFLTAVDDVHEEYQSCLRFKSVHTHPIVDLICNVINNEAERRGLSFRVKISQLTESNEFWPHHVIEPVNPLVSEAIIKARNNHRRDRLSIQAESTLKELGM